MGILVSGFPSTPNVGDTTTLRGFEFVYTSKGWKKNLSSISSDKLGKNDVASDSAKFDGKTYAETMAQLKIDVVNEISDGAESTYMTLKGIENEIKENDSSISGILNAISTKANNTTVNTINNNIGNIADLGTASNTLVEATNELNTKKFDKKDIMNIIRPLLKLITVEGILEADIDGAIDAIIIDINNGEL